MELGKPKNVHFRKPEKLDLNQIILKIFEINVQKRGQCGQLSGSPDLFEWHLVHLETQVPNYFKICTVRPTEKFEERFVSVVL